MHTAKPDEDGNYWFPFSNLQYEASDKNEYDLSYLNKDQFTKIIIKDGHFINEKTGERIRFLEQMFAFHMHFQKKKIHKF